MRPRTSWMTDSDDTILEFLQDCNLALPPRAIEYNLRSRHNVEISYSTVNRRLKPLFEVGLVQKEYPKGGFYSLTEKGRAYLAGDLEASELERDEK
ncbi:winged helix-turn-helix domain-containing protein [Halomarina pelagica]|uniref:winged helix-turn-helix domain-containing protein n=1 Tax=Halomarina pelagica TaxID=2961599 RepID=UPI0020C30892|nr:winged helix-turn-helix domain-containing protein [Halomarina sp. BND7]